MPLPVFHTVDHGSRRTDISEDWEKDFDLDMTEEEVQMALSKVDASGGGVRLLMVGHRKQAQ